MNAIFNPDLYTVEDAEFYPCLDNLKVYAPKRKDYWSNRSNHKKALRQQKLMGLGAITLGVSALIGAMAVTELATVSIPCFIMGALLMTTKKVVIK